MGAIEAVVVMVGMGLAGVLGFTVVRGRLALQRQRYRVVEMALQHPAVDRETQRQLLEVVAQPTGLFGRLFRPRTVATLGWLGMFIGLGCLASGDRDAEAAGPVIALISLGVLSLPLALRELDARRLASKSSAS